MAHKTKLTAKKRFLFRGNMLNKGDVFTVSEQYVQQYLNNDLAEKAGTMESKVVEAEFSQELHPAMNKEFTLKELKAIAKENNIEGYSRRTKDELLDILKTEGVL